MRGIVSEGGAQRAAHAVAIGYRRSADDRLEQDPDRRIRETLGFCQFAEIGSVRQLVLWMCKSESSCPLLFHGHHGRTVQDTPAKIPYGVGDLGQLPHGRCSPIQSILEPMSRSAL